MVEWLNGFWQCGIWENSVSKIPSLQAGKGGPDRKIGDGMGSKSSTAPGA